MKRRTTNPEISVLKAFCIALMVPMERAYAASDVISQATGTLFGSIYQIIRTAAVAAAAVSIGICAIRMITGGEGGMEKAKKTCLWTLAGLIVVLLAPLVITTVKGWAASGSYSSHFKLFT